MLVDVTTKCNMSCGHCIRDFGNGKRGHHMTWETFEAALPVFQDYSSGYDEGITLSGGEPTLWPHLRKAVEAMLMRDIQVHIVTNGSKPNIVWDLIDMQETWGSKDKLLLEMSVDDWHDPSMQDEKLENYFRRQGRNPYDREGRIRNNARLANAGRASHLYEQGLYPSWQRGLDGKQGGKACVCDTLHLRHDGSFHLCGCNDSPPIGKVGESGDPLRAYWDYFDGCEGERCHQWREYEKRGLPTV